MQRRGIELNRMSKQTEIIIELHEVTIFRRGQNQALLETCPETPQRAWCSFCEREAAMLTAEAAARVAGVSRREIYRRIEKGTLHFHETAEGLVQVCLLSLRAESAAKGEHNEQAK